ncbi:phytanoyl-CoA dioxygenase family protein [Humibacillus xanthopallidus]|uniref:phytanoyl-CoA dioxygenase family protein n=1 Tax=Humibacillus xanthopallidus TaxID=412689 RepID=UPI00384A87B3
MTITSTSSQTRWIRPEDARLTDLLEVLTEQTELADYPHATRLEQEVLVYEWATLRHTATDEVTRRDVQAELARALSDGPGIVVLAGAFDAEPLDRATAAFERMIAEQRASGASAGDHFAKPGANDRIWNALEKLAVVDPGAFVAYYANDALALVAQAWLGPGYQVTSQLNVVNPGGAGQTVHRDYHLGFQSAQTCSTYPAHVHALSQVLTLQGAVAHVDMAVESGPTLYLPHSQKFSHGYVAYQQPDFQAYFLDHHVQLPLAAGDAVFFNPALPRRGHQPHERRASHGQPAADQLGLRPGDGDRRPGACGRCDLPHAARRPRRRYAAARGRERRRRHRRGLCLPDEPRPRPARRRPVTPDTG